ncbi:MULTISPECIES: aminoacetone oxidase family FAD-binding enzyme [Acidiphilium]|uniref:NAD(P)/FAD-dependent oxidoreductase n=1 Tax=Acidiphilium TaxID=522 RepID=UPI00021456B0|nr:MULTISPECIES: aminoacetone oxidase family FAD-binding enzyme [Acidiphilium]EGO95795.1 hypothetical protein APM_1384 [Acidiphilium sp. PM]KDM65995.1 flavoprotein [Acidiphilium sp. JA12-A1]UNC14043.1 aminoacetone oxidase family FAD-binding enzyme [Acidiphilium multivorum]
MRQFDVIILGAGAAGLMAAIAAGRRGRRVLVLDHAPEAGRKILISGGGRCNFTNIHTAPDRFFSENRRFCASALAGFSPRDFLAMVEAHRIAWHEKTLGQLFCDGPARAIVAMLLAECAAAGVEIRTLCTITEVGGGPDFRLDTSAGPFAAGSLILATGGLSIPKLGATGFAHDLAARFGLRIVPPRPALVPFVLEGEERARATPLAGVSQPVVAACGRARFREAMLFTHRGLSGPAILQVSTAWREGMTVGIDLLPDEGPDFLLRRKREAPKSALRTLLGGVMPQRMADAFMPAALPPGPVAAIADRALLDLGARLKSWRIVPAGTEGYVKAEVTAGGVDTAGLSQRTLAAAGVPGLFVVGEAVDVTGWLGGYNFQWAWASGWAAGSAA